VHDFVLRRSDDEKDGDAHLLRSTESTNGVEYFRAHVGGHLSMHEHQTERIDEIRRTGGGNLAERARGTQVDIEAGNFVEDHRIGQRQAQDCRGCVLEIELGRIHGGLGMT